jgi:hypothetical protein
LKQGFDKVDVMTNEDAVKSQVSNDDDDEDEYPPMPMLEPPGLNRSMITAGKLIFESQNLLITNYR